MALNKDADARLVATLAASRLDHFNFSFFSFGHFRKNTDDQETPARPAGQGPPRGSRDMLHGTMPPPASRPCPDSRISCAGAAGAASLRPLACRRDQPANETGSLLTTSRPTD
jgi:hypothetical protein